LRAGRAVLSWTWTPFVKNVKRVFAPDETTRSPVRTDTLAARQPDWRQAARARASGFGLPASGRVIRRMEYVP
jgi:hypothetical protein